MVDCMLCAYVLQGVRLVVFFFFQAEDGIRDLVRSRGLGDVYKRQSLLRLEESPGLPSSKAKIALQSNGHRRSEGDHALLSLIHI